MSTAEVRRAIAKYNRLKARLEQSRSDVSFSGSVQDLSSSFVSASIQGAMLEHLEKSCALDVRDDAVRLVLAAELYYAGKIAAAKREYVAIVSRDSMQAVVAAKMLQEIGG